MPSRFLCNDVQREGVKPSPVLAPGFSSMLHYTTFGMASFLPLRIIGYLECGEN